MTKTDIRKLEKIMLFQINALLYTRLKVEVSIYFDMNLLKIIYWFSSAIQQRISVYLKLYKIQRPFIVFIQFPPILGPIPADVYLTPNA